MIRKRATMKNRCWLILVIFLFGFIFWNWNITSHAAVMEVEAGSDTELITKITAAGSTPTKILLTGDIEFSFFQAIIPDNADIIIAPKDGSVSIKRGAFLDSDMIFQVNSKGKLTLESNGDYKLTVSGEEVKAAKPAIVSYGTVIMDGVTVEKNNAKDNHDGGAIQAEAGSVLEVRNSTFTENHTLGYNTGGGCGGAISAKGAKVSIENSTFYKNTTSNSAGPGGAVYVKGGSLSLDGCVFEENNAMLGGAVYLDNATAISKNTNFKKNTAVFSGGAITVSQSSSLQVQSGTFDFNESVGMGGAIYIDNPPTELILGSTAFEGNKATDAGGAIWHCPYGTGKYYDFAGMDFYGNTATNRGDDVYVEKARSGYENGGEYFPSMTYSGESLDWYLDKPGSRYSGGNRTALDKNSYQGTNAEISMKSDRSQEAYEQSKTKAEVIFVNNKSGTGGALGNNGIVSIGRKSGLVIQKEVQGEDAPSGDEFVFQVIFSDGSTYDGVESGSSIKLKNGERKVIIGVPEGVTYMVQEAKKECYTANQEYQTGQVEEYGSIIKFINYYQKPENPDTPDTPDTETKPTIGTTTKKQQIQIQKKQKAPHTKDHKYPLVWGLCLLISAGIGIAAMGEIKKENIKSKKISKK